LSAIVYNPWPPHLIKRPTEKENKYNPEKSASRDMQPEKNAEIHSLPEKLKSGTLIVNRDKYPFMPKGEYLNPVERLGGL
jgi:hypothetical protein